MNTKYFAADHPVAIDEAEIRAYYDANKDKMQRVGNFTWRRTGDRYAV